MRAANDGSPAKGGGVYGSGSGLEKIRQAKASLAEVAKKERKQAKGALEERVRALESQLASSRETAARRMGEAEETIAKLKAALKRSRRQAEENEAEGAARNRELRRTLAEAKCEASKEVEGVGEEMTVALAKWRRRSKRAEATLSKLLMPPCGAEVSADVTAATGGAHANATPSPSPGRLLAPAKKPGAPPSCA